MSESSSNPDLTALNFKSATLYAIRVVLHTAQLNALQTALDQRMADAGAFFENEAVVIDAMSLSDTVNWHELLQALRAHKLEPIGVMAQGENLEAAKTQGLTQVDLSSTPSRNAVPTATPEKEEKATAQAEPVVPAEPVAPTPVAAPAAMVVNRPLRSGQRIYAKGTDLIVIGMVSQGAEVIADGNIHVYGPLRGKAMAGARGDTDARIFSTHLDPELLAIAGVYRVIESALEKAVRNHPAIVQLRNESLQILPLESKG